MLEIGPGAGALTALMAARGAAVVAVEIDPGMAALTAEAVAGLPNVRVLNTDALASKSTIAPDVLDNVRAGLAVAPGRRLKLVANLPYNIATPIVSNLLVHPEFCPSRLVITIQLELAERMRAEPEDEAYGALSVLVQALADCQIVRTLPPAVFWPRPKVDSAIVADRPPPREAGRDRRPPLVPPGRPPGLPPPPQEPPPRPPQPLARPPDQARDRRPPRIPRPHRPDPRRGDERRGTAGASPSGSASGSSPIPPESGFRRGPVVTRPEGAGMMRRRWSPELLRWRKEGDTSADELHHAEPRPGPPRPDRSGYLP